MASVLDNLREASFRGVPFFYEDASDQFGRRFAKHEYPGRDGAWHEDMGIKAQSFEIKAYVLEPDHLQKAERLFAAINEKGPGTLVHPWLGSRRVVCTEARRRFSTAEGGMAEFTLTFEEAGEAAQPSGRFDTAAQVPIAADASETTLQTVFNDQFNVNGYPQWVADDAASRAVAAARMLDGLLSNLSIAGTAVRARSLSDFIGRAGSLVRSPALLSSSLATIVRVPSSVDGARAFSALSAGQDWSDPSGPVPLTTATRVAQNANAAALADLTGGLVLVNRVRAASLADYPSSADALTTRDNLANGLGTAMESAPDALFRSYRTLRTTSARDLTARAAQLPRLTTYTTRSPQPVLTTAWRLYGAKPETVLTRATEIGSRNHLRHPGFVPSATALELVTEAADG